MLPLRTSCRQNAPQATGCPTQSRKYCTASFNTKHVPSRLSPASTKVPFSAHRTRSAFLSTHRVARLPWLLPSLIHRIHQHPAVARILPTRTTIFFLRPPSHAAKAAESMRLGASLPGDTPPLTSRPGLHVAWRKMCGERPRDRM